MVICGQEFDFSVLNANDLERMEAAQKQAAKVKKLVAEAKAQGQKSVAITDHGYCFGAYEFYKAATLDEIYANSDVISLHCPLTPENYHLLNQAAFDQMKDGVMIINTSRGGLVDSQAAIEALKTQKIGALGMDVYENERDLFFEDKSNDVIQDDVFRRLSACHNVLFTGHQAFLTAEALISISETTLGNLQQLEKGEACPNELA